MGESERDDGDGDEGQLYLVRLKEGNVAHESISRRWWVFEVLRGNVYSMYQAPEGVRIGCHRTWQVCLTGIMYFICSSGSVVDLECNLRVLSW